MPPLAANELVNRKPISIIVTKPASCQVTDLVMSLVVVSILDLPFEFGGMEHCYPGKPELDIL